MHMSSELNMKIHRSGSERAVLTLCMKNPKKIVECVAKGLEPKMFAVEAHKYIFMAIQYLTSNEKSVDPVAIMNVFSSEKIIQELEGIGGIEYLDAMLDARMSGNVELYVEHIMQSALRREIYQRADMVRARVLEDEDTPLIELAQQIENEFREVGNAFNKSSIAYKMGDTLGARLSERAKNPTPIPGIRTGFEKFDKATNGLGGGELTVIGARSKVGKSALLGNFARKIGIEDGLPLLYIDTEMSEYAQEERLLAALSGVPANEIKNGMFARDTVEGKAKDKLKALKEAQALMKKGNVYHIYMPFFTPESVASIIQQFKVRHDIRIVFFDYIKMPSSDSKNATNEYQLLGFLTSALKDVAGQLDIPIVAGVQLNRGAVNAEEIDESMVAGSDRILMLADRLCFLRNKSEKEYVDEGGIQGGNQKLKIKVQRSGESDVDDINIYFNRPIIKMSEVG